MATDCIYCTVYNLISRQCIYVELSLTIHQIDNLARTHIIQIPILESSPFDCFLVGARYGKNDTRGEKSTTQCSIESNLLPVFTDMVGLKTVLRLAPLYQFNRGLIDWWCGESRLSSRIVSPLFGSVPVHAKHPGRL